MRSPPSCSIHAHHLSTKAKHRPDKKQRPNRGNDNNNNDNMSMTRISSMTQQETNSAIQEGFKAKQVHLKARNRNNNQTGPSQSSKQKQQKEEQRELAVSNALYRPNSNTSCWRDRGERMFVPSSGSKETNASRWWTWWFRWLGDIGS